MIEKVEVSIEEKQEKEFKKVTKAVLSDSEYRNLLRMSRGGKDCEGCDD